jgi:hypothetical protein
VARSVGFTLVSGAGDQYGPYHEVEDDFDRRTRREVEDLVRRGTPPVEPSLVPLGWYYLAKWEKRLGTQRRTPYICGVAALLQTSLAVVYGLKGNVYQTVFYSTLTVAFLVVATTWPARWQRWNERLNRSRAALLTASTPPT